MLTDLNNYKSFLFINPFGIGDVIFTTPVIEAVRVKYPNSYIGYLCNRKASSLMVSDPRINKVFIFERDDYRILWKKSRIKCIQKFLNFLVEIRKHRFDVVLDFSMARDYSIFSMLVGIRRRVGYYYKKRGLFLTHKIQLPNGFCDNHVVDYHKAFLPFLGVESPSCFQTKIFVSQDDETKALQVLEINGIKLGVRYLCVMPGAGDSWGEFSDKKRWPLEKFIDVVYQLSTVDRLKIVLLGSVNEKDLCDQIQEKVPGVINLGGKLSLMVFAGVLKHSQALLVNDGGPLHMGVGLGIKVASIFGPVSEKVYGPYSIDDTRHVSITNSIDCRPCYKKFKMPVCSRDKECLRDLSVEKVLKVVRKLLHD